MPVSTRHSHKSNHQLSATRESQLAVPGIDSESDEELDLPLHGHPPSPQKKRLQHCGFSQTDARKCLNRTVTSRNHLRNYNDHKLCLKSCLSMFKRCTHLYHNANHTCQCNLRIQSWIPKFSPCMAYIYHNIYHLPINYDPVLLGHCMGSSRNVVPPTFCWWFPWVSLCFPIMICYLVG